jgi:hypothetical protein
MIKAARLSHTVIPTLQYAQVNQPNTQFAAVESPQAETGEIGSFTLVEWRLQLVCSLGNLNYELHSFSR